MADYGRRPIVAHKDDSHSTEWLTPDGAFRIVHEKQCPVAGDCYTIKERFLSRLGDAHMRVLWPEVISHADRATAQEALNVILYPYGSTPSPEYAGLGTPPDSLFEPELEEWLTPDEFFAGGDE